ncbi:hypothetical protein KPL70_021401 [Citrus sinensis]|nr:hypothetical protein KPL70_021401 [Citrus sinensis]
MRIYLQALDYEIWEVICDGPFMPMFKDEVGDDIPKPSSQWSELEKRKMSLNSKAMNALFCALDKKEFHRVSSCESAQEIWNKLEVVYEGTNQVKESKISRYTCQYELFQMEQNENVYSMYTRFTDIVNTLGALGKTFSNSEKVKKIIRPLPKEWRPKRTAIEEAKNLNTLPLDDLIGSLISYEEDLAAEKGDEEKKKSIALKASKYESDGGSEPDDEELAMLARRFRKFFKKTGERRKFQNFKNQREKKEVITCYECKKPGHIRSECPLINKLKKKATVATWDDSEEDSSDEEGLQEVSNLALMAIGDDDNLNEVNDPTYDELYDAFKDLHNELMKIGKKNGLKKKKNKWYLDSGCSRHMTGNYAWFSCFTKIENGGEVSFGDNSKGKILGIGNVGKVSSTLIENILFVGNRCGNVYIIDIECASTLDKCFSALHDDSWLWHRRTLRTFVRSDCMEMMFQKVHTDVGYLYKIQSLDSSDSKVKISEPRPKATSSSSTSTIPPEESPQDIPMPLNKDKGPMDQTGLMGKTSFVAYKVVRHHMCQSSSSEMDREDRVKPVRNKCSMHRLGNRSGDPSRGVTTRSSLRNTCEHNAFISQIEPKSFEDTENDESWIMAMQEELNQFERNNVWELVPKPEHQSAIEFSSCMSKEFEMSMMGELKYFFGLQIKQNEEGIFINQAKYVKDLLKRFGIDDSKTKNTPMSTTTKLDKDEKGKEVDIKMYRGMIGSLLYLTASRPDIMFSVCLCARFQSCPKESHLLAVKRIFRYLSGTIDIGLWYPRGTHIDLTCYSDADFAGYKVDRKSTSDIMESFLGAIGSPITIDRLILFPNSSTKHTAPRHSSPPRSPPQDFESLHFSDATSAQRFREKFMGKPVTPSFSLNILEFSDITVCGHSITQMLSHWKQALSIEEPIYENLVRVFYSNIEFSSTRRDELYTSVGGIHIAFNEPDLCSILGIAYGGLDLYTARKELSFSEFRHVDGVRNICRHRDLSDDICSLSFSIITRILNHFQVPIVEPVFLETRKLGREIISTIGFFKKRGKWEKTTSSKNEDTLLAPEDDRMLNDVCSEDELPDFRLGARPRVPRRAAASQDDEPTETAVPPAASAVPEDSFQQLLDRVDALSQ